MDKKRNLGPLDCNWDTCGPRNRSVYLWHAGLWTACRESYTVVSKYWKEYGWPDLPAQMQDRNRGGRNWFMFEESFVVSQIAHMRSDYMPLRQIIDNNMDI
jgi:hypothetical protein